MNTNKAIEDKLIALRGAASVDRRTAGAVTTSQLIENRLAALRRGELPDSVVPKKPGRLLFALDLTASRQAGLNVARQSTAAMFDAVKRIGGLLVKLAYYRGIDECKASGWEDNADKLTGMMAKLKVASGGTQIARILRLALAETETLNGVVFIGDCFEEEAEMADIRKLAAALADKKIPLYVFHEYPCEDGAYAKAEQRFRELSDVTGGAYVRFTEASAAALRELLSTLAAFSTAGHAGLKAVAPVTTPEARQLQQRLLRLTEGKG